MLKLPPADVHSRRGLIVDSNKRQEYGKKEDLKGLLEQYFPNNDTGEITEPKIREFWAR